MWPVLLSISMIYLISPNMFFIWIQNLTSACNTNIQQSQSSADYAPEISKPEGNVSQMASAAKFKSVVSGCAATTTLLYSFQST